MDRHVSKHYLPVVLRTRAVITRNLMYGIELRGIVRLVDFSVFEALMALN